MKDNSGNRAFIILGMHRSGTSALAGSLEAAGVYLGDVNTYSEDNRKGNRESARVMALHDDLLSRNGGAWNNPVHNLTWDPIHRSMRDLIVESFEDKPLWGFKDPRSLLSLSGWLQALPNAEMVGIFRHPFLVAESLNSRNDIEHEAGLSLWISYNRVLLWYFHNVRQFPILEFSEDGTDFLNQLHKVGDVLGLENDINTFFNPSLRQQSIPDMALEPSAHAAEKLYGELKSLRVLN